MRAHQPNVRDLRSLSWLLYIKYVWRLHMTRYLTALSWQRLVFCIPVYIYLFNVYYFSFIASKRAYTHDTYKIKLWKNNTKRVTRWLSSHTELMHSSHIHLQMLLNLTECLSKMVDCRSKFFVPWAYFLWTYLQANATGWWLVIIIWGIKVMALWKLSRTITYPRADFF